MLKLLRSESFYDESEPSLTVLDLSKPRGGLEKKAAHEDIQSYIDKLSVKPGYTYLHILAMTAGEWYSSNRNADYFPEDNLKRYYKTFETTPAYVYRSHLNKDIKKSYGKVIFSIYNERMHRVELIAECPDDLVEDVNSRISMGDYPATSMALKTPYDTCSICHNKARSRQEYCTHLKTELNKLYPDGRKVMAINDGPLTAFDISFVVRPADVNSSVLQKVAYDETVSSAELAEVEGLTEDGFHKRAQLKKLSELIKEISDGCYVVGAGKSPEEILGKAAPLDLPLDLVEQLHHFDISQVLASMADLGISPSLTFLAELIVRKKIGDGYSGIGEIVENFLHVVPTSSEVPQINFEEPSERSMVVYSILKPYSENSSLFPVEVEKRASNVGYAGNGPHLEPNFREMEAQRILAESLKPKSNDAFEYAKLLLSIGGAALMAKYFITRQIEKKMREQNIGSGNHVKITIVKQASDYLVTSQLSKLAMQHALPKKKEQVNETHSPGLAFSVTKRIVGSTKTRIGGKLSSLLRIISLGFKVQDLGV